jgi:hypothetical protein
MGRKSIADKIIESLEYVADDSVWILCYNFRADMALSRFYTNRDRIISKLGGKMIQYNVFLGPVMASTALHNLAERYGGKVNKFELANGMENMV